MDIPTKATPAGCFIGLVGIALDGYAIFCGWIFYLITQATNLTGKESLLRFYGTLCVVSLVAGLWLLRLGWGWALQSDMSVPDDPDKPVMRF